LDRVEGGHHDRVLQILAANVVVHTKVVVGVWTVELYGAVHKIGEATTTGANLAASTPAREDGAGSGWKE